MGTATLGIPVAIEVTRALGLDRYVIAQKFRKIHLASALSAPVQSTTTEGSQGRLLDQAYLPWMTGRRIVVVDDVAASGNSLKATLSLARQTSKPSASFYRSISMGRNPGRRCPTRPRPRTYSPIYPTRPYRRADSGNAARRHSYLAGLIAAPEPSVRIPVAVVTAASPKCRSGDQPPMPKTPSAIPPFGRSNPSNQSTRWSPNSLPPFAVLTHFPERRANSIPSPLPKIGPNPQ